MSAATQKKITSPEAAVLAKAVLRAGKYLGINQTDIGDIIGRTRAAISRGVDPKSTSGQLSTYLVRVYRSLYSMVGGDMETMKHWMRTQNHHLGDAPIKCLKTPEGLVQVMHYLDASRGKL